MRRILLKGICTTIMLFSVVLQAGCQIYVDENNELIVEGNQNKNDGFQKGEITTDFTTDVGFLEECTAIYEEFDGNFGDISRIKNKEDLPQQALKYLARIEEYVGVPVKFIGTGAGRENIIIIK